MSVPVLDLPQPPEGAVLGWCSECASIYVGAVQDRMKDTLQKLQRDGKSGVYVRIQPALDGLPMLEPAVALGAGTFHQVHGTTPLCWSHLGALKPAGVLPASQLGGSARGLG